MHLAEPMMSGTDLSWTVVKVVYLIPGGVNLMILDQQHFSQLSNGYVILPMQYLKEEPMTYMTLEYNYHK